MTRSTLYFGTDGIRGRVGQKRINAEFILKLGWAVGKALLQQGTKAGTVLIGKDTRISGYMLESALQAGLSSAGVDIYLVGPMPTPAIAYLTRTLRVNIGIVISASHNPYYDNGVKFFSSEGFKLSDGLEEHIEQLIDQPFLTIDTLGKAFRIDDAPGRYIEFCKSAVPHRTSFKGLKIVVDCANGATYHVAPNVFRELGATVIPIHINPNGLNINERSGSTHPDVLQSWVLQEKADLGIAFDGDGDRVVMVDHTGEIVDGDELLFILAKNYIKQRGFLKGVIGTYMSNIGLELALKALNVPFKRTAVGDRYVMMALEQEQWILGGESSGHIICLDVTTTGDGIISALRVLQALTESGKNLHDFKSDMHKFPQETINVRYEKCNIDIMNDVEIKRAIQMVETKLNGGRILIRQSGTEPLIRVMIEGEEKKQVQSLVREMAELIQKKVENS